MSTAVLSRGTHAGPGARAGRQAPLSGRQGAASEEFVGIRLPRSGDTIAVARKIAEGTA